MRAKQLISELNISFERLSDELFWNSFYYSKLNINTKLETKHVEFLRSKFANDINNKEKSKQIIEIYKKNSAAITEILKKEIHSERKKSGLFDHFYDGLLPKSMFKENKFTYSKTFSLYMVFTEFLLVNYAFNFENFNHFLQKIKFTKHITFSKKNKKRIIYIELEKIIERILNEEILKFDYENFRFETFKRYYYFYNNNIFYRFYKENYNPFYTVLLIARFESIYKNYVNWHVDKNKSEKQLTNFKNGVIFNEDENYPMYTSSSVYAKPNPFRN